MSTRRQTQGLAQIRLAPLVQEALRAQAEPPRNVDWGRFAVRPYNREMAPRQVIIAIVFGVIFAGTYLADDNGVAIWLTRIIIAGGGLWILGAGLIAGVHIAWHTRHGLPASADVVNCERSPEEPVQVAGEGIVYHPVLGDFRDGYLVSAPWAPTLVAGDRLEVLVDPIRQRTWFTFGVSRADSA